MDTISQAADDRFVTVDGLRLRYIEQGTGLPVILLHGASLGSSADVFIRNLAPLAEGGVRAIAYDQPGFGLSDTPTDFSVAYRRDSIMGLIDTLGIEKAAIVGHSQAGNMAYATALANPDRITSVVILGTGSLLPPLPEGDPAKAAKTAPAEGREGTPAPPSIDDTRKLLEANLYHHDLITDEELALRHSHSLGRNFEAFVERGRVKTGGGGKKGPALWERMAGTPVPIRLIFGREDRANAYERAMILKERQPDIDLHIIDGCKHLVPWDAADASVRLTLNFLKG